MLVWTDHLPQILNQRIQIFHDDWISPCPRRRIQLSRESKREGLLPDCRVGVKESESNNYSSWIHWQQARQLTFWTMVRVWRSRDKAGWLQVRAWHDRSYIAWIPLLAHGLTVKLSRCPCSDGSLAGQIAACLCGHSKCNLLLAQARPRMIQHLSSYNSEAWCYLLYVTVGTHEYWYFWLREQEINPQQSLYSSPPAQWPLCVV